MDYNELVKSLRMCCGTDNQIECDCANCLFKDKIIDGGSWADFTECVNAMGLAAAAAIEELQATLCQWCVVCPDDKRDLSNCEIYESCRAKPPKEETE